MRRSTVLYLPPPLIFPASGISAVGRTIRMIILSSRVFEPYLEDLHYKTFHGRIKGATRLSIMTVSTMTISIMTFSVTTNKT